MCGRGRRMRVTRSFRPAEAGGDGGWGSDKKVNSYPMTSEDDQSGRLTVAADVAEPKRPWRGCRFHPDRAWNSGSRIMSGTFRDMATAELQRLPNESGPGCFLPPGNASFLLLACCYQERSAALPC